MAAETSPLVLVQPVDTPADVGCASPSGQRIEFEIVKEGRLCIINAQSGTSNMVLELSINSCERVQRTQRSLDTAAIMMVIILEYI